jgi:hypothetical protein
MLVDPISLALEHVEWSFARNRYKDVPSFVKGVGLFQPQTWDPDRIVVPLEVIRIGLAPRVIPSSMQGFTTVARDPRITTIRAPKGGFSAANLLFLAHNALGAGFTNQPDPFLHSIVQIKRQELFEPPLWEVRTKYWVDQPHPELPAEVLPGLHWSLREAMSDARLAALPETPPLATSMLWINYTFQNKDRMKILRPANPEGFSAGDLVKYVHGELGGKQMLRTDQSFFEGLRLSPAHPALPPGYHVKLGG